MNSNWKPYSLDEKAHELVLSIINCDATEKKEILTQAHKMRLAVSYGLERFWGEQVRLKGTVKGDYWRDTWLTLCHILGTAGIDLPDDEIQSEDDTKKIKEITDTLWELDIQKRKIALMILTQLCDCMVWWTQRYKKLID